MAKNGVNFWAPYDHDFLWHLSLINNISNPFSINLPIFSGFLLKNYHFFFDYSLSLIANFFSIDSSLLLFQIFPIVSALLYIYTTYCVGKIISQNYGGVLLVVFNTLLSSFGIFFNLLHLRLGGESLFWSMQSASIQTNPPLVMSLILINILLIFLFKSTRLSKNQYILSSVSIVLLPLIKVYSVPLGYFLFLLIVIKNFRDSKTRILKIFPPILLSILIFLFFNHDSTTLLKIEPFWFVRSLFYSSDRLYFPLISNFIFNKPLLVQLPFLIIGLIIFLVGNISWRIIGIIDYLVNQKKSFYFNYLLLISCLNFFIPIIFVQEGTYWNTIQFFYYGLLIGNIFLLKYFILPILSKKKMLILFSIILLSFLGNFDVYKNIFSSPNSYISKSEYEGLKFLSYLPQGTVLTYPYDQYFTSSSTPHPLYKSQTSAYVSAYSKHQVFLEDEMNAKNLGFDVDQRQKIVKKFFEQKANFEDRGFLGNNEIDYIYLSKEQLSRSPLDSQLMSLELLYQNPEIVIYKVRR